MRQGKIVKRCSTCGARIAGRECATPGHASFVWQATVDVAPAGAPRRRETKSFKTRPEAREWAAHRQDAEKDGTHIKSSAQTLGAYLDRWWVRAADLEGWEENTKREYHGSIERLIKPRLGAIPLQALTTEDIKGLYAWLLREGKVLRGGGRGPLSRKTVHNVDICLRSALQDAVESDPPQLRRNPASKAFRHSRKDRPEMLTWSVEETRLFLEFTAHDPDGTLFQTALLTGMRRGELLGLRVADLDLDHAQLKVRRQYARDGVRGLAFKGLKNDSAAWRTIDLDPATVDRLRAHLKARVVVPMNAAAALLFCGPDGAAHDPDSVTRRFQRRALDAGLPRLRFHDCRHTHATQLLENGESLPYVAERLGDRVETVVETYAHVTSRSRSRAASQLAGLIFTSRPMPEVTERLQ